MSANGGRRVSLELFAPHRYPGLFVTVDGPNGSGKSTLVAAIVEALGVYGDVVHPTREPSPSGFGDFVRGAEPDVGSRGLAALVAADRHHQLVTEIVPQLDRGATVVCDRYVESSLVLQRIDGVELDYILAVNSGIARPDLRIQLLAEPATLRDRLAKREQAGQRRLEREGGPERELELYAQANALLGERYGLAAAVYDTTATEATALGVEVAALISDAREGRG